ncbi:hypothetical protein [Streptomyces coffeae]|uniref:Uncharacterized protein n=1 Tax=Streptomyces coffeae TaxID=621382 RepID=A0ABS1NEB2_9ACTN|nr:hypothetical protein [Streptomyces coffeae]MBL1098420.1 hypothetical protein [Streptomyces coffeae]
MPDTGYGVLPSPTGDIRTAAVPRPWPSWAYGRSVPPEEARRDGTASTIRTGRPPVRTPVGPDGRPTAGTDARHRDHWNPATSRTVLSEPLDTSP